jgi:integrase
MARVGLEVGHHGNIRTYYQDDQGSWIRHKDKLPTGIRPQKWRAITKFRDDDGCIRQIERYGPTEAHAKRNLRDYLKDRAGPGAALSANSRFADIAAVWLEEVHRRHTGTTYDRYRSRLNNHVLPDLGQLRIRECTAGRFKSLIESLGRAGLQASTLRGVRSVLSGVMQEAVDRDLIPINPAKSMSRIEGSARRRPVAFDSRQLLDFLTKLDADPVSRRADLPDLIRFLFGTGCRFGEALALRWYDVNLTDTPHTVEDPVDGQYVTIPPHSIWINGNIVAVKGKGLVRHDGKTFASRGIIGMPTFLHTLLVVRKPADADEFEPVFPSATLGYRHPSNVQRAVRRMRMRIGYPRFTTHVGRKTVATALDEAGQSARQIADQLRHSNVATTQNVYMGRGLANPAAAAALDAAHQPKTITVGAQRLDR